MMKYKPTFFCVFFVLFYGLLTVNAQDVSSKFSIKIYKDRQSVALESNYGNTWNSLFIRKNKFEINQFGMLDSAKNRDEAQESNYIIGLENKGNMITLTGIKGVNWKKINIKLPKKGNYITLNESGILE